MDKYLPGIVQLLLGLAASGIVAVVVMSRRQYLTEQRIQNYEKDREYLQSVDKRLSLVEGEMRDVRKDFDELASSVKELKTNISDVKGDTGILKVQLSHISSMADDIRHTFERAFEMRPRP
jgi:septal ring factor EnvC (AmiA/AmiB activator)